MEKDGARTGRNTIDQSALGGCGNERKQWRAFLIQIISQAVRLTRSFMTYKTGFEQWDILKSK